MLFYKSLFTVWNCMSLLGMPILIRSSVFFCTAVLDTSYFEIFVLCFFSFCPSVRLSIPAPAPQQQVKTKQIVVGYNTCQPGDFFPAFNGWFLAGWTSGLDFMLGQNKLQAGPNYADSLIMCEYILIRQYLIIWESDSWQEQTTDWTRFHADQNCQSLLWQIVPN